jgi:hypothetical protein
MSGAPANAREALIAELIGDAQTLLDRADTIRVQLEQADANARLTTAALNTANEQYRAQVNDQVARLRGETSSIITLTTQHAAKALVGQQTATLQEAATKAVQAALSDPLIKRMRREWLAALIINTMITASITGSAWYFSLK